MVSGITYLNAFFQVNKVRIASKLLRTLCISSCSASEGPCWENTAFIRCCRFHETASSGKKRCLKCSLNIGSRFCTSNLLSDQFTTALELYSRVKTALWEWKGWRKGKRGLQAHSEENTGKFPNPELPRKLTFSHQTTFLQNAYHIWIIPQQTQAS